MIELLTALVVALTGHPALQLSCEIPYDLRRQAPAAVGFGGGDRIWVAPAVCRSAMRREHFGLWALGHESLHVRLPHRSEAWIERWDDWYAENVVRWKLGRIADG